MLIVIVLSLLALVIAAFMHLIVGVAIITAIAIFLGLEGIFLHASALSPPRHDMKLDRPKGLLNTLLWPFQEGRSLNYPINYNPYNRVFFHGGFALLALSITLLIISQV